MNTSIKTTAASLPSKSRGMPITYQIAMAAGRDAANRRMHMAGRTAWSRADYNFACRTANRLMEEAGYPTA